MNTKKNKRKANKVNYSNHVAFSSVNTQDTNSINTAIIYYKRTTENLEKEKKIYEQKLQNIAFINKTFKTKLNDIEKEKQKLVTDFQTLFTKFNLKSSYEIKIEEKLNTIKDFLKSAISSEKDIQYLQNQEFLNIRISSLNKLKENYTLLKEIISLYQKENEYKKNIISEIKIQKYEGEEVTNNEIYAEVQHYIKLCEEKLNNLRKLIQSNTILSTQLELESSTILEKATAQSKEIKHNIYCELIQSKTDCKSLRSKLQTFKENKINEIAHQLYNIQKLDHKVNKKVTVINEINHNFKKDNDVIIALQKEYDNMQNDLENILTNLQIKKQEIISEKELLNEKVKEISENLCKIQENFETVGILQEELKNTEIRKEDLRKNFEIIQHKLNEKEKYLSNLEEKLKSLNVLKNTETQNLINLENKIIKQKQIYGTVKNRVDSLEIELERKQHQNDQLKCQLSLSGSDIDNSELLELVNSYLSVEYEEQTLNNMKELELEDLCDKICYYEKEMQHLYVLITNVSYENEFLDKEILEKEEQLNQLKDNTTHYINSIQTLKQNVYQGKFITAQDLNKKTSIIANAIKIEQEKIQELKINVESMNNDASSVKSKKNYSETNLKAKISDYLYSSQENIYNFD